MAKGLNYERRMRLANRFSKPAPKATSYNRFGSGVRDRELDTPTKILGGAANLLLPSPSMIKQAVQDPSGTAKGAVEVASLLSPIANVYRGYKFATGDGLSVTGADMSDVEQAAELAGLIPSGKAVSAPLKAGLGLLDYGVRGAARRTTPSMLSAASGGIISGGPKVLARSAGSKPVADAPRSRLLPSGKEEELNRVTEARLSEGFIKNKPTPEVVGATRFGGAETSKLSPEALEERASTAAEYVSPEELADELSALENMGFATVDKIPAKSVGAVSLSQKELADRTAAALSGIKKRERKVNAAREARGEEPFEYEPHFDPYDLTKKELETLWGGNPIYVYNEAGELIPELGAHLGHGSGKSLKYGYSATLGTVRGQRGVANMRYGSEF
jgi:hypothetical protein